MKLKLYNKFNFWQEGGPIWLIGDTHFDDEDCKLMDPRWPSSQEQINIINKYIGKKDTLIILGDVGNIERVKQLKGYKILIMGNHDLGKTKYIRNEQFIPIKGSESINELKNQYPDFKTKTIINSSPLAYCDNKTFAYCDNQLFDEVYEGPLFISDKILLSHESINIPFGINIHGHEHGGKTGIVIQNNTVKYNTAANVIDWKPVRLDKCIEGLSLTTIHRLTIDNATNKKNQNINSDYYMEPLF